MQSTQKHIDDIENLESKRVLRSDIDRRLETVRSSQL